MKNRIKAVESDLVVSDDSDNFSKELEDTQRDDIIKADGPTNTANKDAKNEVVSENINLAKAILYEDSSNIINYSSSIGTIDPSLEEYKKIMRIGAGELLYEKNGISFYTENKFYRFDFHRFDNIKIGDNYLALVLKGLGTTKLFIVENNNNIIATINNSYSEYIGS